MSVLSEVRHETTPSVGIEEHQYAKLFPMLDEAARQRLTDDIRENGVLEPIVFLGKAILDGRNRYYAARELGIAYPRVDYLGSDPLGFVISRNLHRRHLSEQKRASIAADIAKLRQGARTDLPSIEGRLPSQPEAAALMNVSVSAVERAAAVKAHGVPELVAAVDAEVVSLSAAAEVAALPAEKQVEIVAAGPEATKAAAKEQREKRKAERAPKQEPSVKLPDLPPAVQALEAEKAERRAAAKAGPAPDASAEEAEIAELRDALAAADAKIAELEAKLSTFQRLDLMYRDWTEGGWEQVIKAKDDTIAEIQRTALTRISRESHEKASNLKAMRGLAKKLDDAGLGRNAVIDLDTGEMTNA